MKWNETALESMSTVNGSFVRWLREKKIESEIGLEIKKKKKTNKKMNRKKRENLKLNISTKKNEFRHVVSLHFVSALCVCDTMEWEATVHTERTYTTTKPLYTVMLVRACSSHDSVYNIDRKKSCYD